MNASSEKIEQYTKLLDAAPCGVGLFDLETNAPVYLNPAYYQLIGYTEDEYKDHMSDMDYLMFPNDLDISHRSKSVFDKSGSAEDFEYCIVRKNGEIRWVKLNVSTVNISGKTYAYASFTDTTKEKEAYLRLSTITENTEESISLIRVSHGQEQLVYANEAFFHLIGVSREEYLKDMRSYDKRFVSEEDYQRIGDAIKNAFKSGNSCEVEYRLTRENDTLWVSRKFRVIPQDEDDTYIIVSSVRDITDKKLAEMKRQHERALSNSVIEELKTVVLEWDLIKKTFHASKSFEQFAMSEVNTDDLMNNRGPKDLVHTDDQKELRKFDEAANSGAERVEATLRLKMKDGSFHWCRMMSFFEKNDIGEIIRTVGIIVDVNDEYESNLMFRNLLNELPGGVAIFRVSDTLECQYFSDGFAALSGRNREEIEAIFSERERLNQVVVPDYYKEFYESLKKNTDSGKRLSFTYHFKTKSGEIGWLHVAAIKIRDDRGCPVYYCIYTNPTDEAELYRSIVEDSAIGVFIADRKTRATLYVNQIFCDIYGANVKSISGKTVEELLKKQNFKELLSTEQIASLQYDRYLSFHVTRDSGRYLSIKAKAVIWNGTDSYILYVDDETAEHQRQLQLQNVLNEVPAGIGVFEIRNHDLNLVYLNDAYNRIVDLPKEETEQYFGERKVIEAVHPEDRHTIKEQASALLSGNTHGDIVIRMRAGKNGWTWFHITISVIERTSDCLRLYVVFSNCDDMVKVQQEMKIKAMQEKTMLASIPGGIAAYRLKKDGRVTVDYASDGFARITGYTMDECIALTDINCKIVPEDLPTLQNTVAEAMQTREPINLIYRIFKKDGSIVTTRLNGDIIYPEDLGDDDIGVLYAVQTLVSDKTIEILKEQEYYRQVLSMLGISYWEWSIDHGYYSSENFSNYMLSRASSDKMKESRVLEDIVHPDDIGLLKDFLSCGAAMDKQCSVILRMAMTDGSYQWTEILGFREYDHDGNLMRLSATLRNMNNEWVRQKKELEKALKEAQEANQAKTDFLSRVSHDMRTPLNGILGMTGFLKNSVNDSQLLKDIEHLENSGRYLLNLINDTLDVSRIESGKFELNPILCDGRRLLTGAIELIMPILEAKHIQFESNVPDIPFSLLYVDVGRIQQVFMNIMSNAIKFTPEGGTITFSMRNLGVTDDIITDEISIRDTGIGMNPEFLPHIFEPYIQADSSKRNAREGTGLGLAIVKKIIEAMGGTISVESELGKGTCFTYTMKLKMASESQFAEWKNSTEQTVDTTVLAGKRVLLCEDHPLNAEIALRLLKKKQIVVERAENGQSGLKMFCNSPAGYYDAILMDIRMPVMDGYETTMAIRALHRDDAHTIPIIAMSANAFEEDIQSSLNVGMDAHLAKPIEPEKLYVMLSSKIADRCYHAPKKVLIVDGSESGCTDIRHGIETFFEISEAKDSASAIEMLNQNTSYNAIMIDMIADRIKAIHLIKDIQSNPKFNRIAILMIEENEGDSNPAMFQLDIKNVIYKNTSPEKMVSMIINAINFKQND